MNRNNWGYSADRSLPNWTGRVPRQSRITGEWASRHKDSRRIPKMAYVGAAAFVLAFYLANFI
jgi:hypothetical protein